MENIIKRLKEKKQTISTMESCTGGGVANAITNIEGASEVFCFAAVTYSNEFKIKMGVSKDIINQYTVYSTQTAKEMAKAITIYSNSDYGIGITGKLNKEDKNNPSDNNNIIYVSIYDKNENKFHNQSITACTISRKENKEIIISLIVNMLKNIIN